MRRFTAHDLTEMDRIKRLNIINSITGIKPANMIATRGKNGLTNVAIFSSVVHLGSNPPYIGFVLRPQIDFTRDTYRNIKENGLYTINHINSEITEKAHFSSAKLPEDVSEFDALKLTEQYLDNFFVPFLGESKLKFSMKLVEEIPIKLNNTILIIGEVLNIYYAENSINEDGNIDLAAINTIGISGLHSYYKLEKTADYPYAHFDLVPKYEK